MCDAHNTSSIADGILIAPDGGCESTHTTGALEGLNSRVAHSFQAHFSD